MSHRHNDSARDKHTVHSTRNPTQCLFHPFRFPLSSKHIICDSNRWKGFPGLGLKQWPNNPPVRPTRTIRNHSKTPIWPWWWTLDCEGWSCGILLFQQHEPDISEICTSQRLCRRYQGWWWCVPKTRTRNPRFSHECSWLNLGFRVQAMRSRRLLGADLWKASKIPDSVTSMHECSWLNLGFSMLFKDLHPATDSASNPTSFNVWASFSKLLPWSKATLQL